MLTFSTEKLGRALILLGIFGLLASAIISFTVYSGLDRGALPAASFLSIMIGITFVHPTLLQESKGEVSTMRFTVFVVIMVFATLYIKLGWNSGDFENFTIDRTWVYILGLAFGSKAFQKFAEEDKTDKSSTKKAKDEADS